MSDARRTPASITYAQKPVAIEAYGHPCTSGHIIRIELVEELNRDRFAAILNDLPGGYMKRNFALSRDGFVIEIELMSLLHPREHVDEAACVIGSFFGRHLGFADFWLTQLDGRLEHRTVREDGPVSSDTGDAAM